MGMLDLFHEWLGHRNRQSRPRRRAGFLQTEILETRQMLTATLAGTTLTITATTNAPITVAQDSNGVHGTESGNGYAFAAGTTINTINVVGSAGNDTITINSVFNTTALTVDGAAGNNTLISPDQANTWAITGANSGTLNGNNFSKIQNLTGGGFNDDFQFGSAGSVSGMIDGMGGINALDYSTRSAGALVTLVTPTASSGNGFSGTATNIGGGFLSITDFDGSTGNTDKLIGLNSSSTWDYSGGNAGDIDQQFFFTGVENLMGGTGTNTLISAGQANTWLLTGGNSGNVDGEIFSNFQNLTGGGFNDDFQFGITGGFVSGKIDGMGGINILDYSTRNFGALITLVTPTISNNNGFSGTASAVGGGFLSITDFHGSTDNTDKLIGLNVANIWDIAGGNSGDINQQFFFTGVENLTGGSNNDSFVFSPTGFVQGTIIGSGGSNTLDYSNRTASVVTTLQANASTAIGTAFFQIGTIIGSSGTSDTLIGINHPNIWNLTGINAGTVGAAAGGTPLNFQGFKNLTGGNTNDSFKFTDGTGISGKLNGGGGFDTLDYSALTNRVVVVLQTNAAPGIGGGFTSIENVIGSSASNDQIIGANVASNWNITGTDAGNVNGTFFFSSIENLSGGTQSDSFNFQSRGQLSGTIDGGQGTNTISYAQWAGSTEILTASQSLTVGGVPATLSTSLNALDQTLKSATPPSGYAVGDTIKITGSLADGTNVNGTLKLTGTAADTVASLIARINALFLSGNTAIGATATLSASGQIVLTTNQAGKYANSIVLAGNSGNPSGTRTQFSTFLRTISPPVGSAVNPLAGTQILTSSQPLTIFGQPAKPTSRLDALDQTTLAPGSTAKYAVGDTIIIAGSLADGTPVSGTLKLTGTSADTVSALIARINALYLSGNRAIGATATINASGQIVLTTNQAGKFATSITVVANPGNPSGTFTQFSTFVQTIAPSGVVINLQTSSATGLGGFVNVNNFVGTSSAALPNTTTLVGANTTNTWNITGAGAGNVNTNTTFSSIQNIVGGSNVDVFRPAAGGSIAGTIDGGPLPVNAVLAINAIVGGDWLDYSALTTAVFANLTTGVATDFGNVVNIDNVHGSNGASSLTGNAVGNILVGGQAADSITGGSGRSLLIGGLGADTVTGNLDQDIVIGGYTNYDNNLAALQSILNEWQSYPSLDPTSSFVIRVTQLRSGGGLNGNNVLIADFTVHTDQAANVLRGGTGPNWLWGGPSEFKDRTALDLTDTPLDNAPILTGSSIVVFSVGQGAVFINQALTITDTNTTNLVSATVKIGANYNPSQDKLNFVPSSATGNIVGSFDASTGTLTLISAGSTATDAQFQLALRRVTYSNSSSNPTTSPRTIAFQVFDGRFFSNSVVSTVNVNFVPVLAGTSNLPYSTLQAATVINPVITVSDASGARLAFATVKISANYQPIDDQDILGFVGNASTGIIFGSFDTTTGTLTLRTNGAQATVAQYQAALRLVTYQNNATFPFQMTRTVSYQVSDGTAVSNVIKSTITFGPSLSGTSELDYITLQGPAQINPTIAVADPNNSTLQFATVQISGSYVSSQDVLGFVGDATTGSIVGSFNSATGQLKLTSAGAPASVAQYQSALRLVTYRNSSGAPVQTSRTVDFQVTGTTGASNIVQSSIVFF